MLQKKQTLVIFLFAIKIIVCHSEPIVKTPNGLIQGTTDKYANLFLGIPFAKPPIGDLRWKDPVPADSWSPSILNASVFKPSCAQLNCSRGMPNASCPTTVSEDCLYLNVFTPLNMNTSKAVLLFIHGGNFQFQGANSPLVDGRYLANYADIIVVTIQYRLGALGFLVTGLESGQLQGNFGIMDQRLAIKWIHENIASFGGDPSRITLFGQSAGGESVTIHLLSEDMQNYFNNAIIQSSPMSIPFKTYNEFAALYVYFADEIGCQLGDINCLRKKSYEEILEAQMIVEKKVSSLRLLEFFESWLPWTDGTIIKGQLLEIEKWTSKPLKPFIIGTLTEECIIFIDLAFKKPISSSVYIELMLAAFKKKSFEILKNFPPDFSSPDQRNLTSSIATDWVLGCSSRNFLEKAVMASEETKSENNYYHYVFNFPIDFSAWDQFSYCEGHVCHGSDMPYTFDTFNLNFTSTGRMISQVSIRILF